MSYAIAAVAILLSYNITLPIRYFDKEIIYIKHI